MLVSQICIITKVCTSPHLHDNSCKKVSTKHIFPPPTLREGTVGYFDGAANAGRCGVGMVIFVEGSLSYRLLVDVGCSTNTKSKLMVLWGLLYFVIHKNIQDFHVWGNSKVIVDWALGKHIIHSMDLKHWLLWVEELFGHFSSLTFQHVYREFNSLADELSKRAIGLGAGQIFREEHIEEGEG